MSGLTLLPHIAKRTISLVPYLERGNLEKPSWNHTVCLSLFLRNALWFLGKIDVKHSDLLPLEAVIHQTSNSGHQIINKSKKKFYVYLSMSITVKGAPLILDIHRWVSMYIKYQASIIPIWPVLYNCSHCGLDNKYR